MDEIPARKKPLGHDAADARLEASALDYGRVSREVGLTSEQAVTRLRALFDDDGAPSARRSLNLPSVSPRLLGWIAGAVIFALLAWAVTGLVETTARSHDGAEPVTVPSSARDAPVGVGGFAEIFVAVYLGQAGEGAEDVLDPYLSEPVEMLGLSPGRLYVQNMATVAIEPTTEGWSVSVAAQILVRVDGGYGEPGVQYYRVEVVDDDGLVSRTVPMLIARP